MKKTWTPVQRKKVHNYVRLLIQLLFFLLLPSAFTTAFSGVKYIFLQMGLGHKLTMTAFLAVLVVLGIYTIVFGRFFCGYACAFGSLGDALHIIYVWGCRKCKKKPIMIKETWCRILSFFKYIVLLVILLLCFMGIYPKLQGISPWEVFSLLRAGNFRLAAYGAGLLLLLAIMIGMAVCERFFCRFLCPMGAFFALLPVIPLFSLQRDREKCLKGCCGCKRNCPAGLELPQKGFQEVQGDCFQCGKCIDACPKNNVTRGGFSKMEYDIWFTLFRAVLLAAVLFWAGV